MAPSDQYVYIFVRQDISPAQQIVQSNHATLMMAGLYGIEGTPNIVLIGVPDKEELLSTCRYLSESQIPHHTWFEPDFEFGFSAITTAPISGERRNSLAHYRLWRDFTHPSPNGKAAASNPTHAGSIPAG